MLERGPTATLHLIHVCCATCHKSVDKSWHTRPESTVAHRFLKHGFKVLLHHVVDSPLQASRCLVLQSLNEPCSFIPGIPVYFGP